MKYQRRKQIELLTTHILQETQCISPLPIDVRKVAHNRGLDIKPLPPSEGDENISGVLVVKGDKGTIGFNNSHPRVRKRFTIAHELGHYELQHQRGGLFVDKLKNHHHISVKFRDSKSSTGEDIQEQEANAFAAALLMPASLVAEKLQEISFDLSDENDDALRNLADIFGVSTQAMAFRLANLGYLQLS